MPKSAKIDQFLTNLGASARKSDRLLRSSLEIRVKGRGKRWVKGQGAGQEVDLAVGVEVGLKSGQELGRKAELKTGARSGVGGRAGGGARSLDRQLATLVRASAPWLGTCAPDRAPAGAAEAPPLDAPPLDAGQLEALRGKLQGRYLRARNDFESLEPALRGVLGEAQTDALSCSIRGLRYQEALKLLDQALPGAGAAGGDPSDPSHMSSGI